MISVAPLTVLSENLDHPVFGEIALTAKQIAADDLNNETKQLSSSGLSVEIAKLHRFRKEIGYYKNATIIGFEQTVASLNSSNFDTYTYVAETKSADLIIYLSQHGELVGLLVFMKK